MVQSPGTGTGIALVQSAAKSVSSSKTDAVAFGSSNTAGNLILAFVRMSTTSQTVKVIDKLGNTYTDAVSQQQTSDGSQIHLFYAKNVKAGSNTVTATFSSTNSHAWLAIYEYSGLNTSAPLDKVAHAQGSSSSPNTGSTSTTSAANELIFGGLGLPYGSGISVSANAGDVLEQQASSGPRGATEDAYTTTTGTYAAKFSLSRSTNWSSLVATFSANNATPLGITTTSLPSGTASVSYSQVVQASGGETPYAWKVISGSLPDGLTLDASSGAISGTPTTAATSNFTLQVTDNSSPQQSASQPLSITIKPMASGGIALVQSASSQGSGLPAISQAFASANTAGNLILAFVRMSTNTQTVTVSDSAGNTYADAVHQLQDADTSQIHVFYATNVRAGANTVTAMFSGSNNHPFIAIYEYSGLSTTAPLDQTASVQASTSVPTCGPTPTTTSSPELVFSGLGLPSSSSLNVTGGSGFVLEQQDTIAYGSRAATEDEKLNSQAAVTATYGLSGTANWSCVVATFK